MNTNRQSQRARRTRIALGITVQTPWPEALAAATLLGRDWALIDRERGSIDAADLEPLLLAAEEQGIPTLVRLVNCDPAEVAQVLDGGAHGVLTPSLSGVRELVALAEAVEAHPRSLRARAVGEEPEEGATQVSVWQPPLVAIQIEDAVGLLDLPELLAVERLDVVFVDPQGLARSMGYVGRPETHRVRGAIDDAFAAIRAAGKTPGVFADAAVARQYLAWGGYFYSDPMASRPAQSYR
jgi:4-hydroxy-2-oxoheptanedioate aldolase